MGVAMVVQGLCSKFRIKLSQFGHSPIKCGQVFTQFPVEGKQGVHLGLIA